MKVTKNATSFGLEKQLQDIKISASKNKIQANNIDALAIMEWLEQKSETKNFIEVLRGLAYTIKTTQGLEDVLDLSIKNAEKSFNEKTLTEKNDNNYIKVVKDIICETELVLEFCEVGELEINLETSIEKEKVLIEKQEYIRLKQNSSKEQSSLNSKVEEKTTIETKIVENQQKQSNQNKKQKEKKDEFLNTFVNKYNSHNSQILRKRK